MEYIVSPWYSQFLAPNVFPDSCIQWGRKRNNPSGETMRGSRRVLWLAMAVLATVAVPGGAVSGGTGETGLLADSDAGDGNVNVDLAVRQVTVTPVRAHAGDGIHVEVVIENKGEGTATTNAELLVNGKVVARQLFTWGMSAGDRLYRLSFDWDTRGYLPASTGSGRRPSSGRTRRPSITVWTLRNRWWSRPPAAVSPGGSGGRQRDGDGSAVREIPRRRITSFLYRQPPAFDPDFVLARGVFFPH